MIIFLYGEDTYRSKERLKELVQAFSKKYDNAGINIITLEGESLDLNEFRKNILTRGLLAKKRLIVLKNVLIQKKKELLEGVEAEIASKKLLEDNILIFWEGASEKELYKKIPSLFNLLQKGKEVREFQPLTQIQLLKWIEKEVNRQGGQIEARAKQELALATSNNLWQAANEITKLVGYKGKKIIKVEDVALLTKTKYDENIFHLTEALAQKNQKEALRLIEEQLILGVDKMELLSRLIWQFRTLIKVKEAQEEGVAGSSLAREAGVHPFVASRAQDQVRIFTMKELKNIYARLLEIDYKIKTSQGDARVLFDLFAVSLVLKE